MYHFSPFGDSFSWGYALAYIGVDPLTTGATWLFGGVAGCAFLFAATVSALIYLMRRGIEINRFENCKISDGKCVLYYESLITCIISGNSLPVGQYTN